MPDPVAVDNWILIQGEAITRLYSFQNSNGDPFDLSGFTVDCQFRRKPDAIYFDLEPSVDVVSPATNGQVTLTITAAQSSRLSGNYVFDLKATDATGNTVLRLVQGVVAVKLAVTRGPSLFD